MLLSLAVSWHESSNVNSCGFTMETNTESESIRLEVGCLCCYRGLFASCVGRGPPAEGPPPPPWGAEGSGGARPPQQNGILDKQRNPKSEKTKKTKIRPVRLP